MAGSFNAVAILLVLIAVLGRTLTRVPLHVLQLAIGVLLLLFGFADCLRRHSVPLDISLIHDEEAAFEKYAILMRVHKTVQAWDRIAFVSSFQITMLEGTEVVFLLRLANRGLVRSCPDNRLSFGRARHGCVVPERKERNRAGLWKQAVSR